ncbi:uncharacterized protein At4g10930 isoform X2 [Argentina anserina]|uniref:uncharacterized protein At4g10930 isoform X2 n=1 Tax=Argentina anserina TaxID=57926 RepID=UPI0021766113|nr:uncharacterized protein At4g10930 isoform X2 [Potentilla anserina]
MFDEMEVNLVASGIQEEEEAFGVDENYTNDNPVVEGENETCGICMDTIIDRGVLDCCQHWFCFACIDNWATITNLCPLCQNEFQVITCVPVYDTVGSNKLDDDSSARDDDWSIEGTNNTVSFPSYYIDENSVICLDGDHCKVRSGLAKMEENSNLDTSIACDSCDLWYHAFCVGFDPENTSENMWLCPRCVAGDMPQNSDAGSVQRSNSQCDLENRESLTEDTFSRKVSVSSVDTGDTAVVVSMVTDSGMITVKLEAQELELSLSCDTSFSLPSNALAHKQLRSSAGESIYDLRSFDDVKSSSGKLNESHISERLSDSQCSMDLNLGLSAGLIMSVDTNSTGTEHDDAKDVKQHYPTEEYLPKADRIVQDANSDAPDMTGGKRKRTDCSDGVCADDRGTNPKIKNKVPVKKIRDGEKIQQIAFKDKAKAQLSDSGNGSSLTVVPKDSKLKCHPILDPTSEILSIVRTTNHKSSKGLAGSNSDLQSSEEQDSMASLRVKKIMRRDAEDKESSVVVQRLRKEIREAVRNKSSKDIGENQFDPKLLDAFRAALAGSKTEPVKKLSDLALKARKSMLEKGKVRENLTKKIYGTSNGRRKRAWDRDCQIEFWKHRCIGEPEKIETLKSVLGLLNGSSKKLDTKPESNTHESTSPILSRLYLADTSVFPRKDNIKPLVAVGNSEPNDKLCATDPCSKPLLDNLTSTSTDMNKVSSKVGLPLLETNGNKNNPPGSDNGAASKKVHQDRHSRGSLAASSGGSKLKTKDVVHKTGDIKVDKRKWALEVLARKMSGTGKNTTNEKQQDNSGLKGNYPLLAQLPTDMKPVLSPCRHNKIPMSVRQTQLYRMTEHLLRKANLPVIRRTADTELAVADATNIEKEIADRSNSKLVYLNLCSQEILHLSKGNKASGNTVFSSSQSSACADRSGEALVEPSSDPLTEEALRNAGLLSDSPPNSPHSNMEVPAKEDDPSLDTREEGPDNVFEMDVNPDLDIYGDFEYNLEDEDYIGATATKVSNMEPEGGASKIKVVFSTLQPEISNHTIDLGSTEKVVEVQKDSSCMLENDTFSGLENSTKECETDNSCVPLESIFGKEGEELSAAECEELYGPDKEPLIQRFPGASEILYGSIDAGLVKDNYLKETESCGPKPTEEITSPSGIENQATNMTVSSLGCNSSGGEDSMNHSQPDGSGERNKKPNGECKDQSNNINSISKKVEAYIKEHIRPLCKSGVITTEQYKWAVAKTTEKVMKYHSKAKSASFLIKEGEKVKKLAEQYVETSQKKEKGEAL